jgi:hypothetical protein
MLNVVILNVVMYNVMAPLDAPLQGDMLESTLLKPFSDVLPMGQTPAWV